MPNIVLVMHEPLGTALARCAEHVLGATPALCVFDIPENADVAQSSDCVCQVLLQASPVGSLVLCDLYGATPFNVAQRAIAQAREQGAQAMLVTGANLNMVLKALTDRVTDLNDLSENVRYGAIRGIVCPNADQAD